MPSTPPSMLNLDQALGPWAWWPTMMPAPLLGDSQGRAGKPTACEDVPKASCSPLLEESARSYSEARIHPLTHVSVDRAYQAESVGKLLFSSSLICYSSLSVL